MKTQCDICERAAAAVLCCADEAALCWGCDEEVHAANKLAEKHQRVPLLPTNSNSSSSSSSSSSQVPICNICQVAESIGFHACIKSCLDYLEAVPGLQRKKQMC
ncbi:B-box zinc finger protein 22-like [Canna indica]|uniref:B-box zinc finger protein 22-like n=1 Tax=Canna indica TaxID=4628 RepID=A0AAQ3Q202_9LILI|nr:B-box zinc finger protein 22-like [Canna indica]